LTRVRLVGTPAGSPGSKLESGDVGPGRRSIAHGPLARPTRLAPDLRPQGGRTYTTNGPGAYGLGDDVRTARPPSHQCECLIDPLSRTGLDLPARIARQRTPRLVADLSNCGPDAAGGRMDPGSGRSVRAAGSDASGRATGGRVEAAQ